MLPSMHGSSKEHDLSLWTWSLSNVWGQAHRMSNMQETCGEEDFVVLIIYLLLVNASQLMLFTFAHGLLQVSFIFENSKAYA